MSENLDEIMVTFYGEIREFENVRKIAKKSLWWVREFCFCGKFQIDNGNIMDLKKLRKFKIS